MLRKLSELFLEDAGACEDGMDFWRSIGSPEDPFITIRKCLKKEKGEYIRWILWTTPPTREECAKVALLALEKCMGETSDEDDSRKLVGEARGAVAKWLASGQSSAAGDECHEVAACIDNRLCRLIHAAPPSVPLTKDGNILLCAGKALKTTYLSMPSMFMTTAIYLSAKVMEESGKAQEANIPMFIDKLEEINNNEWKGR